MYSDLIASFTGPNNSGFATAIKYHSPAIAAVEFITGNLLESLGFILLDSDGNNFIYAE